MHEREEALRSGTPMKVSTTPNSELLPIRVTAEIDPGQKCGTLRAATIFGRSAWLFSIKHLLSNTANILQGHRWTILRPPVGVSWFTSDNPVVRLNYYGDDKYDFNGGWGSLGRKLCSPSILNIFSILTSVSVPRDVGQLYRRLRPSCYVEPSLNTPIGTFSRRRRTPNSPTAPSNRKR